MASIIIGSLAFSIGGAFMGISDGFTKFWPSDSPPPKRQELRSSLSDWSP